MKKLLTMMNFSHIYENEKFFLDKEHNWIDCTKVEGTNGYCDENAFHILEKKVQAYNPEGIHFIDSGNYHYATSLWVDKIKESFTLIVFDHHSDMVKPAFGDILSCGSWIMNLLEHNKYLKKVILIGLSKEQKETIPYKYFDKTICICEDELLDIDMNKIIDVKNPVYISIDKDVLNEDIVNTSWDQGKMDLNELKEILYNIIVKYKVIGVDVCGECELSESLDIECNDKINEEILEVLLEEECLV